MKHPISRCQSNCAACLLSSVCIVSPQIHSNCGSLIRMHMLKISPGIMTTMWQWIKHYMTLIKSYMKTALPVLQLDCHHHKANSSITNHLPLNQHQPLMTRLMSSTICWKTYFNLSYQVQDKNQYLSYTMLMLQEAQARPMSSTSCLHI